MCAINIFILQIDFVKTSCKENVHIYRIDFAKTKKEKENLYETISWWKSYRKQLSLEDLKVQDVGDCTK